MADPEAVDWTTEPSGLVRGMRYHDGRLASLEIGDGRIRVVVHPVGGGVTAFTFEGDVAFGSIGLASNEIVLDIWAFRLDPVAVSPAALLGSVAALYGGVLGEDDLSAAVRRVLEDNAGRLLVSFTGALSGEFSVLADDMLVAKTGY